VNEIIQWRRAGKAYLTEVDHVTVAVSVHPAGGWQWCTNRDNGPSGYDPGLADAKEHAVQFTRLWLSERELEVSLQALKEENAMLRDEAEWFRVRLSDYRMMIDGLETAAHEERAAVVAWLRDESINYMPIKEVALLDAADKLERSEHPREEGA